VTVGAPGQARSDTILSFVHVGSVWLTADVLAVVGRVLEWRRSDRSCLGRFGLKARRAVLGALLPVALILGLVPGPWVRVRAEPTPGEAAQVVADDGGAVTVGVALAVEDQGDKGDDRVVVSLATFGAAATAMVVVSLGYLLRRGLGLVKPPPEQPEEEHKHKPP
jgi:hypothetical protein